MSNLLLSASITASVPNAPALLRQVSGLSVAISGTEVFYHAGFSVPTSAPSTALPVGALTFPFGWAYFRNLDGTNQISLTLSSGGGIFATLQPLEFAVLRLGAGVAAPSAISLNAACLLEYLLVSP